MIDERDVERYLIKECEKRGWLCWKFVSPGRRGVPDRIVIRPGAVAFVEVKRKGGRVSPLQLRRIDELTRRGVAARVVKTKGDIDEMIREWESRDEV
ncbi:MAG: VRR-NUC domain-containing protein [Negativicoccus succinicivorans]|uniref:VRR-NUC domain-containing protein n=1 Tax=Negativicoccus succinicivorans TaxID=620903 RepID=UPI002352ADBF|nr:VRR-NUC domain-containing protein [Negativicoccus succinicivorans]MBS5890646.1 VRR-NUC domain-containing protein [Negativicoccus succinicivorans]